MKFGINMTEMWKPIVNWPYAVSDQGRVMRLKAARRTHPGLILKSWPMYKGYLQVELREKPRRKRAAVHRLVLEAFIGPCPEGKEANHINGDKLDNRPENLEWVTSSENTKQWYGDIRG